MKLEFSVQIFEKCSYVKFHENLSSGSQVVLCGLTDGQAWLKLTDAFRNFANAPKNSTLHPDSAVMPFVPSSEKAATFVLYDINWLVFITQVVSGTDRVFV